jgi:hypothetical protein
MNNLNRRRKKKSKKNHSLLVLSLNRRHKRKMTFESIFRCIIEQVIKECNYGINQFNLSEDQQQ